MSTNWQIERTTLHDMTDVTVRNVTSRHIPLRLNGSNDENSTLIQLLRHAGYGEQEYPYQSHHTNHGWGPKVEGLGVVISRRCTNGEVPDNVALYELAIETEQQLVQAARHYAPFARYLASEMNQPDLSIIEERIGTAELTAIDQETAIEQLQGASQNNSARIDGLAERVVQILEEVSELRGNVGELIDQRPSIHDTCELARAAHTRFDGLERRTNSKFDTVYETLFHTGNGVLSRIGSLEATRHDTIETLGQYDQRPQQLGEVIARIAWLLNEEPGLERNYLAAVGIPDGDELYEEAIEQQAYEEREATDAM